MTQTAINYGNVLWQLAVPKEDIASSEAVWKESEALRKALDSPVVTLKEKANIIKKIFPETMQPFLTIVCKYGEASILGEIFESCQNWADKAAGVIQGELFCVEKPDEEQLAGIERRLCETFHAKQVKLTVTEDKSLIGGFLVRIGGFEIDESIAGRWKNLNERLIRR